MTLKNMNLRNKKVNLRKKLTIITFTKAPLKNYTLSCNLKVKPELAAETFRYRYKLYLVPS
jgi:hypothetical protein